jgi:hypothetical protein
MRDLQGYCYGLRSAFSLYVSKVSLLDCNVRFDLNKPLVEDAMFGDPKSVSPSLTDDIKAEPKCSYDDGVDTYHVDLDDYVDTFASFDDGCGGKWGR